MRTVQTRCFLWIFKTLKYELFEELAEIVLSKSHKSHHHSTSCTVLLNSGFPHKIFVCFSNYFSGSAHVDFLQGPGLKPVGYFNQTTCRPETDISSVYCMTFLCALNNICCSRSKLAFARGTPSDSIAFVNAFKVMCLMPSQQQVVVFDGFTYLPDGCCFKPIPYCLFLLGMALSQKERTAETPEGE